MILAGMCIAIGNAMLINAPNKLLGAVFFSLGLLYIRIQKLDLFTGATQKAFRKEISLYKYFTILGGNLIGVLIIAILYRTFYSDITFQDIANKFNLTYSQLLFSAIGCGFLMTIATAIETPLWVSPICVVAFIMCGFHHCIADMFYFLFDDIFDYWIIVLIGNIIGGCLATKKI